jgi:UPF0716 protein FxsA
MLSMRSLIRFVDRGFILKILFWALLCSVLPIGDIVLILYIQSLIGNYLTLSLIASSGLIGLLFAYGQISRVLESLRIQIDNGVFPRAEFGNLAGAIAGSLLLLTPGFITDAIGIFLFFPFFRNIVGSAITGRMEDRLKEMYEYLKLYEI